MKEAFQKAQKLVDDGEFIYRACDRVGISLAQWYYLKKSHMIQLKIALADAICTDGFMIPERPDDFTCGEFRGTTPNREDCESGCEEGPHCEFHEYLWRIERAREALEIEMDKIKKAKRPPRGKRQQNGQLIPSDVKVL